MKNIRVFLLLYSEFLPGCLKFTGRIKYKKYTKNVDYRMYEINDNLKLDTHIHLVMFQEPIPELVSKKSAIYPFQHLQLAPLHPLLTFLKSMGLFRASSLHFQ